MALLRHVHLPYSVASDEKLLETSHGLGTGGPAASRHRAAGRSDREEKYGTLHQLRMSPVVHYWGNIL